MTRRRVGWLLLELAAVLAVVGFVLLNQANDDAEKDRMAAAYAVALGAAVDPDPEPNRVPATVAWVLSGSAFLAGVLIVTRPPESGS